MKNISKITPNCFIIYSEAGFRKLLKHLRCYGSHTLYKYKVTQCTDDDNAFVTNKHQKVDDDYNPLFDKDGKALMYTCKSPVQYPIKYPCFISFQDETYATGAYYLYIKYIPMHLNIDEFDEFDPDNNTKTQDS